jgi:beta-phosphoglucomutase
MKACIFDFEGVIVHSVDAHYLSWKKAAEKFGLQLDKTRYLKEMSGRKAYDNARTLLGDAPSEKIESLVKEKTDYYIVLIDTLVKPIRGIVPFLRVLKSNAVPIAIGSSSRRKIIDLVLKKYALDSYFETIISTEDVSHAKPHPEIFLTAAKKLSISPSECIVFEDSVSGARAASAAGMKLVLVLSSNKAFSIRNADLEIRDFTKVTIAQLKHL